VGDKVDPAQRNMPPDWVRAGAPSITMRGSCPKGVVGFKADHSGNWMRSSSKSVPDKISANRTDSAIPSISKYVSLMDGAIAVNESTGE